MSLVPRSNPLEEGSVRAIFALNQDKVMNDYLVSMGEDNEEDLEEEYNQKCLQVVSVPSCLIECFVARVK